MRKILENSVVFDYCNMFYTKLSYIPDKSTSINIYLNNMYFFRLIIGKQIHIF